MVRLANLVGVLDDLFLESRREEQNLRASLLAFHVLDDVEGLVAQPTAGPRRHLDHVVSLVHDADADFGRVQVLALDLELDRTGPYKKKDSSSTPSETDRKCTKG